MPSTVAISFSESPTSVMVLVAVITTVKVCVSPLSSALAMKPDSVRGVPSYSRLLLLALMVTFLQFTVNRPVSTVTQ